jgi:hypothetical protein
MFISTRIKTSLAEKTHSELFTPLKRTLVPKKEKIKR